LIWSLITPSYPRLDRRRGERRGERRREGEEGVSGVERRREGEEWVSGEEEAGREG
jgi:hypothetical protein